MSRFVLVDEEQPARRFVLTEEAPEKPAAVRAGEAMREMPRQFGLTTRYALEGLPAMVDVAAMPFKAATDALYGVATGQPGFRSRTMSQTGGALADAVGLPSPQGANERVVGDITRTGFGAASGVGLAGRVADATQGVPQAVARMMASNPGQQLSAAAGAGGAGGAVREAGGSPTEQLIASLAGGVISGAALPAAGERALAVKDAAVARVTPRPAPQMVDTQLTLALRQQGIDWNSLSADVRSALRAEAAEALKTGGTINPATVGRLADFRTVGATPTRGTISLDPVQLTREKNLAKVGANSTDVNLQRLPQLENANNRALIDSLNRVGANTNVSPRAAGEQVIGTLESFLARQKANVDDLYASARDSQGRSMPLDAPFLTNRAANLLDDALVSASLPADVRNALNRVARGEMPLTVDVAEQLKTRIGILQRASSDGGARMALGLVRQAIDETPILPLGRQSGPTGAARAVSPGGLSVPGSTQVGEDAVSAFNRARAANRQMMQTIESTPALKAVYDGIEPDKFVRQFIIGDNKDALVEPLRKLADVLKSNPEAMQTVRAQIAAHLKSAATNGAPDDVARFSAASFRNALDRIGDDKLRMFFSPQEVAQLRATSRVANYTLSQPVGSAVNNSNTGAMTVSAGLDFLDRLAGRVPVIGDTVQGIVRSTQQTNALTTSPLLVNPRPARRPLSLLEAARTTPAPALTAGLLLSAPGAGRENERRGLLSLP